MQELKSLGDFCTTPDFHSLFCRALTCICGKFSLHIAAAMVLPYPTQGKHPAHSMSSHCALHSSHLVFPRRSFPFQRTAGQGLGSLHYWVTCLSSFITRHNIQVHAEENFHLLQGLLHTRRPGATTNMAKSKNRIEAAQ